MPDGNFQITTSIAHKVINGWTHFVLNFDGKQQEIRLYRDGVYINTVDTKSHETFNVSANGRIVIGKNYTVGRRGHTSSEVDELYFFNHVLPETKIRMLSQQMGSCVQ